MSGTKSVRVTLETFGSDLELSFYYYFMGKNIKIYIAYFHSPKKYCDIIFGPYHPALLDTNCVIKAQWFLRLPEPVSQFIKIAKIYYSC